MNEETQTKSTPRTKWYKKGWGIFVVILSSLLLILLVYFFAHFFYYYSRMKSGQIPLFKTTKSLETIPEVDRSKIFHSGEPGTEENAPLSVVGFFDFRCPYSIEVSSTIRELQKIYDGKVQFVFRNFPVVALHPDAMLLGQAGECAHLQNKFWPMYDKIFSNKNQAEITSVDLKSYAEQIGLNTDQFSTCLASDQSKSLILEDVTDAEALGVRGTPTWFINNQKIEGPLSIDDFKKIIDKSLSEINKV